MWPLTFDSLCGRFISGPAEGNWSWGGTSHVWCVRRRSHEVLLCEQRHWRGLAQTAARPWGTNTKQTHTHLQHFQSKCIMYKKRHLGQFWKLLMECKLSNDERAVESAILFSGEGWKRKGLWAQSGVYVFFCFSALLFCPCKVYADVHLCPHQAKSEMQVEFYVSDIQEVRDRFALWSQLWRLPSHADTWI